MSCQGMFVSLLSNCLRSCRADSRVHTTECSWCIIVSAQAAAVICSTQAWSLNAARQLLFFLTCIMNIFFFYNVFITSSRKLRRAGCHHVNKKRLFFLFYYELWSFKKKVIFLFYSLPLVGSYSMSVVFSRCSCCSLYSNFCRIFTCFFFPLRIHVSGFSLLLWAIRPTRALQSVAINTTQLMKNNKNATDVKRCEEFIFFFFNE